MAEPQVTSSYPQPGYSTQLSGIHQQQSLPPVNQAYPSQSSTYPQQMACPQQQTTYPTQQTVYPTQQAQHPPPQTGYPPQEKYPPPNEAPPPPYQAAPPQVVLVNSNSQPVPDQVIVRTSQQQQPNDYLVAAILATIFCCLPCGIVAIIKASNVRSHFLSGDYENARRSSQEARNWTWASCLCGLACDSLITCYIMFWYVIGPLTWWATYDTYDPYSYEYYF